MLRDFLIARRDELLRRARTKLSERKAPVPTDVESFDGLPLFMDQLIAILGTVENERRSGQLDMVATADRYGDELGRLGLTVGQVVHDYGSICQSVTELADEEEVPITAEEFQTFNRCLDEAIAHAVTAYQRQRDRADDGGGGAQLGYLAHEMRNLLATSMLSYEALTRSDIGIRGATGAMLGRSLRRMRGLIDRTLAEVRLEHGNPTPERVSIAGLIEEVEVIATMEANERDVSLSIETGPRDVAVDADPQILVSAVANLVQNAVKFTHPHGHVSVRAVSSDGRVLISVEDECGGLPPGVAAELFQPFQQRNENKGGLGLGLTISLKAVRAIGGEIGVRDLPGKGCLFTIDLPRAAA